jgi:hypothetical protein
MKGKHIEHQLGRHRAPCTVHRAPETPKTFHVDEEGYYGEFGGAYIP